MGLQLRILLFELSDGHYLQVQKHTSECECECEVSVYNATRVIICV